MTILIALLVVFYTIVSFVRNSVKQ